MTIFAVPPHSSVRIGRTGLSLCIALALFSPSLLLAEDRARTLDTVKVQAQRAEAFAGNMDLVRTEDDAQPYTIINRERIERSGATTVEDLLRQQLTMSTSFTSSDNNAGDWGGSASRFSLRGLDASQTLVLINGRRVAGVGRRSATEASDQADLNGIPLSAIERIEVLPASASAIYGSGALGGVINVILRRDYSGHEANVRYESTDDGHAPIETYNLTSSFQLEGGRTQLLFSGQYQDTSALYGYQRDFQMRGRARQLANDREAIYTPAGQSTGNPPAGALVNIRSRDGSPLFGPGSSHFTHIPVGYRGWKLDGQQPLEDNQGTYNLDLARGAMNGFSGNNTLIGSSRAKSANVSASREMSKTVRLFFDAGWSESRQASYDTYFGARVITVSKDAPTNPFGQDVLVSYPLRDSDRATPPNNYVTIRTERAALGFEWELPREWRLVGDYSWSHSRNDYNYRRQFGSTSVTQAVNKGDVDLLRDTTSFATSIDEYSVLKHAITNAWMADSTLRAAGTVARWYAGDITLASGIEHRELRQSAVRDTDSTNALPPPVYRRQQMDSLYAEATVPLVSENLAIVGVHTLDIQLASRHERFDVETAKAKFQATVPTVGLRWLPVKDVILRASWGKGFRAPDYAQLSEPTLSTTPTSIDDPRRGKENNANVYTLSGGNPEITPETSRNVNFGIVWTPERLSGLRLSADWYRIEKRNVIITPSAQWLLDNEDMFPERVQRAAPASGDPYGVGEITQIHTYRMNASKMETAGMDLGARYLLQTDMSGDFDFAVNATFTDYYRTQATPDSALTDWVGIPSNSGPLEKRINTSLVWSRNHWAAGWSAQYYDSYKLNPTSTTAIRQQGRNRVASQLYHDAFVRYYLAHGSAWGGLELTFGIKNLFDKMPPVDMSRTTFHYSTFGDPRMRRLYLNVKKNF